MKELHLFLALSFFSSFVCVCVCVVCVGGWVYSKGWFLGDYHSIKGSVYNEDEEPVSFKKFLTIRIVSKPFSIYPVVHSFRQVDRQDVRNKQRDQGATAAVGCDV